MQPPGLQMSLAALAAHAPSRPSASRAPWPLLLTVRGRTRDSAPELLRWAQREARGYAVRVVDRSPGEEAGVKSVELEVAGPFAYGWLKSERGTHRLVRSSPFNAKGLRQTSFAGALSSPERLSAARHTRGREASALRAAQENVMLAALTPSPHTCCGLLGAEPQYVSAPVRVPLARLPLCCETSDAPASWAPAPRGVQTHAKSHTHTHVQASRCCPSWATAQRAAARRRWSSGTATWSCSFSARAAPAGRTSTRSSRACASHTCPPASPSSACRSVLLLARRSARPPAL